MTVEVPVIDISPWRSGVRSERDDVARAIDTACREIGFLHLAGHTITDDAIDDLLTAMDTFFELPLASKSLLVSPSAGINRGYAPSGAERLVYSLGDDAGAGGDGTTADLFEAFNVGPDAPDLDDPAVVAELGGVFAPNLWPGPEVLPAAGEFRRAVTRYFDAVRRQADELLQIFAVSLGLEEQHFACYTTHSTDTLRLVNYQVDESADAVGRLGMGAHTDYGVATLLLADAVPGLEVLLPNDGWVPVQPKPGHLLVNLGDLLAQWTNDRWRSTLHRVQPPPAGTRRRSAAFFHDGNHDAIISCLPTCTSANEPPRYPPVVAGDHVRAKLLGPRSGRASVATSTVGDRRW